MVCLSIRVLKLSWAKGRLEGNCALVGLDLEWEYG
jgi:hypothetical protein